MVDGNNKSVTARRIMFVLFTLYVFVILFLLIIPNNYRRHNVLIGGLTWELWLEYVINNINLVPLRGLLNQISSIFTGQNAAHELVYLAGNIVGFVPLGFFLPALFVKQRKFLIFFITVLIAIIALELVQVMTMRGSCDIDDLILNTIGAFTGYWIIHKYKRRNQGGATNG